MSAAGVMYRSEGKVLLMRRVQSKDAGGMWSFPAGTIEGGETAMEAAARESEEETGYRPDNLVLHSDNGNGFTLFTANVQSFEPQMNEEHDAFVWADTANLPRPLHPGIEELFQAGAMDSARVVDHNGFINIEENPIIREGVFPYLGKSIDPRGLDPDINPDEVYYVYRPGDEISSEDAINSFKMIPFIDEHAMLGPKETGYTAAEKKGVHGTTGEAVAFKGGVLYSNLKIFSEALANLIRSGKKELSLGYRCAFIKQAGTFAGQAYSFVQRSLRGNHLALVEKGRNNVSILDNAIIFDHLDLNIKAEEKRMPTIEELAEKVAALDSAVETLTAENKALKIALDEAEKEKDKAEDEDHDKEKAEDESDKEEDEKKDEAMDAAIKKISELEGRVQTLQKDGIKAVLSEVSKRDHLAQRLAPHIGTFDHLDKTLDEVAVYGVEKLGIKCQKGHEQTALDGYLHHRGASSTGTGYAMDSSQQSSAVDKYITNKA